MHDHGGYTSPSEMMDAVQRMLEVSAGASRVRANVSQPQIAELNPEKTTCSSK